MKSVLSMGHHTHTVELVEATSYSKRAWHYTAEKRKEWLFNNRFYKSEKRHERMKCERMTQKEPRNIGLSNGIACAATTSPALVFSGKVEVLSSLRSAMKKLSSSLAGIPPALVHMIKYCN